MQQVTDKLQQQSQDIDHFLSVELRQDMPTGIYCLLIARLHYIISQMSHLTLSWYLSVYASNCLTLFLINKMYYLLLWMKLWMKCGSATSTYLSNWPSFPGLSKLNQFHKEPFVICSRLFKGQCYTGDTGQRAKLLYWQHLLCCKCCQHDECSTGKMKALRVCIHVENSRRCYFEFMHCGIQSEFWPTTITPTTVALAV